MSLAFLALVLVFVVCYLVGAPLGYGLIAAGIVYLLLAGVDLSQAPALIGGGVGANFVVLAVPLFIFTSELMNSSGMTDRLFRFAQLLLGRSRGALAQVNIGATLVFSGMTGSAVADASGIGVMSVRAMESAGYPKGFACATTSASAIMGPLLPPSIPLIIYGFLSGTSIGALFIAGLLPAIVLALGHAVLVGYLARRKNLPREDFPGLLAIGVSFIAGLPAIMAPLILIGGIYSGVFTPTESSAVAVLYALVVSVFVYRSLPWKKFLRSIGVAARQTGAVTVLIASAFIVDYAVTNEQVPALVAGLVLSVTRQPLLVILIVNVLFLVGDLFLETVVLQFVMLPIVLPIVRAAGIDLVYFGVIITLNMMIGLGMPSLGVLNFILSKLTQTPLDEIIHEMWPFLGLLVAGLIVLILFPEITLFLPHQLGFRTH
jgi:tripartite ATP-independent transporter DctM subunit